MELSVVSNDKAYAGVFSVILENTITYDGDSFATQIPFDIEVIDPCTITTIHTVSPTSMTIVNGEVVT